MTPTVATNEKSDWGGLPVRFSEWLFRLPEGLPAEYGRFYILAQIGYPLALTIHVSFLLVFWHLDIAVLAAFNLLSVAIYVFACWRHATGDLVLPYALAACEITVHSVIATVFVGFNAVFGIFLLVVLVVTLLAPFLTRHIRFAIAVAMTLTLVGLGIFSIQTEPLAPVPAAWQIFFFVSNILAFCISLAAVIVAYEWAVGVAEAALQTEYERAEMLLENILPGEIAARLKASPESIADEFADATVLFCDIVDFTTMSERLSPAQVIEVLNAVFSDFDDLVDTYGLEKIKTIGDAYMVVAGLPKPRDDHAVAMANLALDMVQVMRRHRRPDGAPLDIRIGMNSGPVVAGVIGHRKFAYDLWGDAVNVAARMESHGQAGRIQVTDRCRSMIEAGFIFSEGQDIEIKGKGKMHTYFLEGRRQRTGPPIPGAGDRAAIEPLAP